MTVLYGEPCTGGGCDRNPPRARYVCWSVQYAIVKNAVIIQRRHYVHISSRAEVAAGRLRNIGPASHAPRLIFCTQASVMPYKRPRVHFTSTGGGGSGPSRPSPQNCRPVLNGPPCPYCSLRKVFNYLQYGRTLCDVTPPPPKFMLVMCICE